jgi:hypothetical protein
LAVSSIAFTPRDFTMGLDDLSAFQLIVPMLALLVTLILSGPASLASYLAWKWSLSRIGNGRVLRPARAVSVVALVVTGAPVAYSVSLLTIWLGLGGTLALMAVVALAAAGLVHAAYRVECIRQLAQERELANELSNEALLSSSTPSFAGATRRRSLILATIAVFPSAFAFALLAATASRR